MAKLISSDGSAVPTLDFYDSVAADYESAYGHSAGLLKFLQKSLSLFKPASKILDVGCGTGAPVATTLAREGHKITGIDITPSMIELSRAAVPDGDFEVADMLVYEPKEQLDAVFNVLSLFALSRQELEIMTQKWAKWVVADGFLCIVALAAESCHPAQEFYNADGLSAEGIEFQFMGNTVQLTLMTKEGWRVVLERAGFDILHTEEHLFVPSPEAKSQNEMQYFIIAKRNQHHI
ncbi:MAG: hypothetical protein Q9195_006026 [Heterodermia aff. obscurata]